MTPRLGLAALLVAVPACGSDGITGPFSGSHQVVRTQTAAASCPSDLVETFPTVYDVELEHVTGGVIISSALGEGMGDPPTGEPPTLLVTINGTDDWGGSADYTLVAQDGAISGTESVTLQWNPTPQSTSECEAAWTLAPIPVAN